MTLKLNPRNDRAGRPRRREALYRVYRIDELLRERGLTATEFAESVGLRIATVSDLARGARLGSMATLLAIADGLGVPIRDLYLPENATPLPPGSCVESAA